MLMNDLELFRREELLVGQEAEAQRVLTAWRAVAKKVLRPGTKREAVVLSYIKDSLTNGLDHELIIETLQQVWFNTHTTISESAWNTALNKAEKELAKRQPIMSDFQRRIIGASGGTT